MTASSEVEFAAGDGWPIRALLRVPEAADRAGGVAGVVAVPGSRHERDAWTQVGMALAAAGTSVLQIDIRGRGSSTNGAPWATMGPAQRRRVALDVAAAVDHLAGVEGVDSSRLGLLVEQDTATIALEAVAGDARVAALAVLSARDPARTRAAVEQRRARCTDWSRSRTATACEPRSTPTSPLRAKPAGSMCSTGWESASRWRPCSSSSGPPSSNSTCA